MTATHNEVSDRDLVDAVRSGDDSAFEELFRRYRGPIAAYLGRMERDKARAEDLAQDAFFSALRHLRATDAEIEFKPWIYEIARNAAIDHWRRASRTEEISVDRDEGLRASDRARLVGSAAPDSALLNKERLTHLQGAFDELGDLQARALVMRDLDGKTYREIANELDVSRSSVESTLSLARRRLEVEYSDISEGRRCESVRAAAIRLAEGAGSSRDEGRVGRHARRCPTCLRHARELGVEPLSPATRLRRKVAGLVPLPLLEPAAERAAAVVAAIVIAGAGGAVLAGVDPIPGGGDDGDAETKPASNERRQDATPAGGAAGRSGARDEAGARGQRTRSRSEQRAARRREARRRALRGNGAAGQPGGGGASPNQGAGTGTGSGPGATGGGRGTGLPGLPDLPNTPNLPNAPNLPNTPELPGVPRLPNTPNLPDTPQLPSAPSLPGGTPSTPSLPSTPNLPSTPQLPPAPVQTPQLPQAPVTPPEPPALPSLP